MICLPFPEKSLWPNGRPNRFVKAKAVKNHKKLAYGKTLEYLAGRKYSGPQELQLSYTINAKTSGPEPDKDNAIAAMKAYQDGISLALGVNDKHFLEPKIQFGNRVKGGAVRVEFGA